MPLNVVIELCKITKASKLFQRNFYLPLLEPLSPKDALRRQLIASEAHLQRMEHYIPVLEEYEKRQARRKLIVKGQVKKRQKKKASMKYVTPLLDMNMPGHTKLRNIFTRKSKGQGQCYTYRVPEKNCTLVITHQMERAIRDRDIIDLMVAQKNDRVVFVLKNNQRISVPLVNYEGDSPFYRGEGWTNKEIESSHHYGKETMTMTRVFEGKEQKLEEWELDMMNMTTLRKKKIKCEDTQEWKTLMTTQAKDIDWQLFESQAKQIVQDQYTPVEDQPIQMKVSSMENTMNVNEKLQKAGKSVLESLPTISDIPEIIKQMKEEGELVEVSNVSGVKVKHMKKDYFVPGQTVKWYDSDLLVPGQTIFNEHGDPEYIPGFTVIVEGNPTLIPGLVMGDDPNKPMFLPGESTITESGILKFTETEDDLPQELDKSSEDEESEEKQLPPKQKVLESNLRPKRQISQASFRELPDVVKDTETSVQVLPPRDEGNGGNDADDEVESENGDEMEDESESIASVIEVGHPPMDTATEIDERGQEKEVLGYSSKTLTTEFLGAEKRALAEENPNISKQLDEGKEKYKKEEPPNENMVQGDAKVNEELTEKEGLEKGEESSNTELLPAREETESEESEVAEKCALKNMEPRSEHTQNKNQVRDKLEYDNPRPASNVEAVSNSPIRQPETNEDGSANKAIDEKPATLEEQSTNVRTMENQVAKVEEMKDQFLKEELKEQTDQEQKKNEQLGKGQLAKQQTQMGQRTDESAKGQILEEESKIEKALTERDTKGQAVTQEQLAVEQIVEQVAPKEQEDENHLERNQNTQKQMVQKQAAEEKLVKQVEKEEEVNERAIKDQSEKGQGSKEQPTDEQTAEEPVSKVQPTKIRMGSQDEKNHSSENQTAEKQETVELPAKEPTATEQSKVQPAKIGMENQADLKNQASKNQTAQKQATVELPAKEPAATEQLKLQPAKMGIENQAGRNQASKNQTTEEQTTTKLPSKEQAATEQTRRGILKEDNGDRQTEKEQVVDKPLEEDRTIKLDAQKHVKENAPVKGQGIEKTDGVLPSKDIKHWSTVVKEFFEVSVVVAGCYFINKLGKDLFNISV